MIDCLKPEGENGWLKRMNKPDQETHLQECLQNADCHIMERAKQLADKPLLKAMLAQIKSVCTSNSSTTIQQFYLGIWTRFLFSCLIDADRINSADFENPGNAIFRNNLVQWPIAVSRLECYLAKLPSPTQDFRINDLRQSISDTCKRRATDPQGIYTLTVPTGGGKTYASLRYALHHAQAHGLERIIYVIPYTSIIEQNAQAIRNAIEQDGDEFPWVLEHHSNLEPENSTWHSKLAAENWDAPIVLTTMVQFLETLFSGGTRGVRRMHQLANSVIIFDEIQTLPVNCTYLFCNALNFFSCFTKTTVVLCTATQPLLDKLPAPEKGQLNIPARNELIEDVGDLFRQLKRVDISDKTKPEGWSEQEIADLALAELAGKGSCLVIVNTKAWAQKLYLLCVESLSSDQVFHLSTSQCPAHRSELLKTIKTRLNDKQPVLCISTQLIEAGVDIDFASVIRFLAGLDSIAQAAGRCNRNGRLDTATVHIVNPAVENIDQLIDIKVARRITQRVLDNVGDKELLSPEIITRYFNYYFYEDERVKLMDYPLNEKQAGRKDTLLNLLSENKKNIGKNSALQLKQRLNQSFKTAGDAFEAIDAPTHSIIVPFGHGQCVIANLCAISKDFDLVKYYQCLKQAQNYSVNVFPNVWKELCDLSAVHEIQGEGIYYLDDCYYSIEFGLCTELVKKSEAIVL